MVTDASLAYGLVLMFFSSVLCSSAGVGGGSLNVPILYSIIGFDYDTATVLSLCTLMGNYLLQVLVNLDKRHPTSPTTPLIYWDAVLVMLPAELGGANLGVIVAKSLPKTIIFTLAMVVLVIAVYFTAQKGKKLYHLENDLIAQESVVFKEDYEYDNEGALDNIQNNDVYLGNPIFDTKSGFGRNSTSPLLNEIQPPQNLLKRRGPKKAPVITIASIIPPYLCCYYACCTSKRAASQNGRTGSSYSVLNGSTDLASIETDSVAESTTDDLPPVVQPWNIIAVIVGVWVLYVACYVVQKQYDQCSLGNYISLGIIYVLLIIQVAWGIRYLVVQKYEKTVVSSKLVEGEIHWGSKSSLVPMVSFLIGITSALLGIGGGELMGPMLLMLKVLAPVSTATTSFMSLLNTSSSVAHYLVLGELPFGYGAAVFAVGALGGVTGRVLALFFVAHYKRASLLVFSLVGVLSCSIFIYLSYVIWGKANFTVDSICS